jgi:nucleobase:cation symporter-1, NCS1 family
MAGIMVTDYYIIKKQKLNVHACYQDGPEGIYWYTGGVNIRAWAAFGIAVAPLMPGFAKSIQPSLDVGGAWKIYTFAWIFGFTIASLIYYVINMWIWPQTVSLLDEAVLPPQKGERTSEEIEGVSVDAKTGSIVGEKEKEVV